MNFDIGQTHRLLVAHRAHGPDIPRGVDRESAGALCPAAQPAQRIQAAIDGRRSPAGRDHVLAVGDEFVFSEAFDGEGVVLDGPVPRQEVAQVITVATQRCPAARSSAAPAWPGRVSSSFRFGGDRLGCMYCTQSHPPR